MAAITTRKTIVTMGKVYLNYYSTADSTAMAETVGIRRDCVLNEVRVHLDEASTQENFTITLDSGLGAEYDVVLDAQSGATGGLTDYVFRPTREVLLDKDDGLVLAWDNSDEVEWSVQVIVSYE